MENAFPEAVYDTLRGIWIAGEQVPGVENLFAPGAECERLYGQMLDAYQRLLLRLGAEDEDTDVEIMISSLMRIEGCISRRMYDYGARFGKK